jgi:hypothetical protein
LPGFVRSSVSDSSDTEPLYLCQRGIAHSPMPSPVSGYSVK